MKHIHTRALALLLCLAVTVLAGKYAVLASGGYTFVDNDKGQSDYWYSLYIAYEALIASSFSHDDITVLYNYGDDFVSKYPRFTNAWSCDNAGSITDKAMSASNFSSVLDSLGENVVDGDDTLVVWWTAGHGDDYLPGGQFCRNLYLAEVITREDPGSDEVFDTIRSTVIASDIAQVDHYACKLVVWSTCNSQKVNMAITGTDSLVSLAGCKFRHALGSHIDTLKGTSADTVGMSGLTAFMCHFINGHDLRGTPYDCDSDADGHTTLSELKAGVDSMYHSGDPYADDDSGATSCDSIRGWDTVQVLDEGGLLSSLAFLSRKDDDRLTFSYDGTVKGQLTQLGYLDLAGTSGGGTPSGLKFGPGVGLETDGDLLRGDALKENQGTWLDTASVADGLVFRSPCGTIVQYICDEDTMKVRGWEVPEFVGF